MYSLTYIWSCDYQHSWDVGYFCYPKKLPLWSGLSSPFPVLANCWSNFVPVIFSFPQCQVKMEWYSWVVFYDWFLILNILHLRFLHAVAYINNLFLFIAELYYIVILYHNLFMQSPGGFPWLLLIKLPSTCAYKSLCEYVFIFPG